MTKRWFIPLILLVLTAFIPWVKEIYRVQASQAMAEVSSLPRISTAELETEINKLRQEFRMAEDGKLNPDPLHYWRLLDDEQRIEWHVSVLRRIGDNSEVSELVRLTAMADNLRNRIREVQRVYIAKFGHQKMADLSQVAPKTFVRPETPDVPNDRLELFLMGYLWSILPMFLVFALLLHVRELMIWPEIPRLALASVFWPIGLFVYPKGIDRTKQIKHAMSFVAQLASLAVGFFGGGMVNMIKAQPSPTNSKNLSQSKRSSSHTFGSGLELYPMTSGIDAGLMVSPWYSHSHALPKGLTLSGFGFVEAGPRKEQFFTNNSLNVSHAKARGAMLTLEVGGTKSGNFIQIGPRFNLVKIPIVGRQAGRFVKSVVAGSFWRVRGPTHYQEWFLSWVSKETKLPFGLLGSTEGFMRFRPGSRTNVGQPQLIVRHPKVPHMQFLSEFWMLGTQPTIRLGVQFSK